ncbi:MAG TPA: matrixin family metalloprotease [Gemmatimonadales bacterium]|nr:matrixin family metalloprotease [Gemmatimonadales bacterium]
MLRLLLLSLLGALLLLLVGDQVRRHYIVDVSGASASEVPLRRRPATPRPPATGTAVPSPAAAGVNGTATVERLARLAIRKRISEDAPATYIDSLLLTTDSVVRRWTERVAAPLRVAIVEGGTPDYQPHLVGYVYEAMHRWEALGLGLRFDVVPDTTDADIVVRWIDRFDIDRTGQADLAWDRLGRIRRASIQLALRDSAGTALSDEALLAVAVHEIGHAIGLPHSADPEDVMYPATRTGVLSPRDRRTAALLYQLPAGPISDRAD